MAVGKDVLNFKIAKYAHFFLLLLFDTKAKGKSRLNQNFAVWIVQSGMKRRRIPFTPSLDMEAVFESHEHPDQAPTV